MAAPISRGFFFIGRVPPGSCWPALGMVTGWNLEYG
jgi:hypothetical protein